MVCMCVYNNSSFALQCRLLYTRPFLNFSLQFVTLSRILFHIDIVSYMSDDAHDDVNEKTDLFVLLQFVLGVFFPVFLVIQMITR